MRKEIFRGLSREKRRLRGGLALHHFHFAQAQAVGSDFHELVALDVLQGFFQAQFDRGGDSDLVVCAGSTNVGELFALGQVYGEVRTTCVFTGDLTGIDFVAWLDEEASAVLKAVNRVGDGGALFHRD